MGQQYIFLTVLLVAFLQGCSFNSSHWDSEEPYRPAKGPIIGDILHTATGHYLSQEQMLTNLVHYPLVYVGETHDNPASHRLQLVILQALQTSHPGQITLGMEMFNRQQQPALDKWVAGALDEKQFLRESKWFQNWGGDFALYRELLEYCRDNNIPVIGLNATKETGRIVSMTPLQKLGSDAKETLPEMDTSDPYQQQMIDEIFGAHGAGATMIESFSRRQTLWDETMAETVASYMAQNQSRSMIVMAGGWHISYGFGIPRRVHRRLPLPYVLVGGENLEIPPQKQDQLMDVDMPPFPMRAVDYLVYQAYEISPSRGVVLGVMLQESDDRHGVEIIDVEAGSAAEKAGILKHDRLLSVDGTALRDNFDLIYALKTKPADTQVMIELERGGNILTVKVNFSEPVGT
ncbi:MAG: PDZ domain-containing protein [Gammaproteobacteria bacterium]|nr:PDZ domain-containing protein [Gammaproteobacteria bacterium]